MKNAINFFEIPALDHNRAVDFYQNLLGLELLHDEIQGVKMAFFQSNEETVGGAICTGDGYKPTRNGVVFYLNGGSDLSGVLNKVETLGGKVVQPKTKLSPQMGSIAFFIDTEGNKVGIHSKN